MKFTWNEALEAQLVEVVGTNVEEVVSKEVILAAVEAVEGTEVRNITGKLRSLGYTCVSMAQANKAPTFTDEQGAALAEFAQTNAGLYTFAEIAANFEDGAFTTRQVQGKLLSMELSHVAKPTEKAEAHKQYTDEQEAEFVSMAQGGACIEDIAGSMGKPVNSARGKALSLLRKGDIDSIPVTRDKVTKVETDLFGDLDTEEMTVEEISNATDKSIRGCKTTLTRRGLDAIDYKGSVRKAKAEAKAAKAEAA